MSVGHNKTKRSKLQEEGMHLILIPSKNPRSKRGLRDSKSLEMGFEEMISTLNAWCQCFCRQTTCKNDIADFVFLSILKFHSSTIKAGLHVLEIIFPSKINMKLTMDKFFGFLLLLIFFLAFRKSPPLSLSLSPNPTYPCFSLLVTEVLFFGYNIFNRVGLISLVYQIRWSQPSNLVNSQPDMNVCRWSTNYKATFHMLIFTAISYSFIVF